MFDDTLFSFLMSIYFAISDVKSLDFICGSKHTLHLREDIADMEAAAKTFEQEDGILSEISKQTKSEQNMYSYPLSDMFQRADANGYTPYCELRLDSVTEFYTSPEQSTNNQEGGTQSQSEASFSVASTLCSLSEALDRSSAPKNVSPMIVVFECCQFATACYFHGVLKGYYFPN